MRKAMVAGILAAMASVAALGQGTVPVFRYTVGGGTYTAVGAEPAKGGTTTIPVVLVAVRLEFASKQVKGKALAMDAAGDAKRVVASPLFTEYTFAGGKAQYGDAMLRAAFRAPEDWHTKLGGPEMKRVTIEVPAANGYVLTSKQSGRRFAVADLDYVQRELLKQVPKQEGKLVVAVTHNTAFYALGDATVCCKWGTHGVDKATGQSFVVGSYVSEAPAVVQDQDVQPLTQQLGQFFKDPLYDPQTGGRAVAAPANVFPAWLRPPTQPGGDQGSCGGSGAATAYFLLEPVNTNPKNNFPASKAYAAGPWHLQNVALPAWYTGPAEGLREVYSFPDAGALAERAKACPARGRGQGSQTAAVVAEPKPRSGERNGHQLIGYWVGYSSAAATVPMQQISPQWDVILVAFSTPDKNAPEGTMQFRPPAGMKPEELKAQIAEMKRQGRRVLLSLGGGGQHFTLADPARVPNFVVSIARIVTEYGFEGVDIDFESPSLAIDAGDTDFRNPKTPSIVNLIAALRQLRAQLGEKFEITLVPEGTQIPAGYPGYGGQFGSYLPIAHALRNELLFMDVQSYNTPPLEGLDGEIYQPGTVDYHAAMTELLLHGFDIGGDPKQHFPAMPAKKVAVGFLTGDTTPEIVQQTMEYLITGKAPAGVKYRLREPKGYPEMLGAMFWTLNADQRAGYNFSNTVGVQLHGYPIKR